MPLFLLYNPRLVEAMMRPIFRYARSDAWPYPFAPHDAGYYPLLNGQTYGMEMERQMPDAQRPMGSHRKNSAEDDQRGQPQRQSPERIDPAGTPRTRCG